MRTKNEEVSMTEAKTEEKPFLIYLKRAGLLYFYESLSTPFILLDFETAKILYANKSAQKVFEKTCGYKLYENFSGAKREKLIKLHADIKNGKKDHGFFEFLNLKNKNVVLLRLQKVRIGDKQLIVVFSSENDPELEKRMKNKIALESNYLDALYHISKVIVNLSKDEQGTLTEIANTISKLFKLRTIWVRLKIHNKYYVSDNFTDANRIYSRRINTPDNTLALMEIGLAEKSPKFKGAYFTIEEERVFDEIIERIEEALLERHLRNKLSQNEKRFRAIIETANDAIVVTNEIGEIIDANKKSAYLFEYDIRELIGKRMDELLPEITHEEISKYFEETLQNGKPPSPIEKTIIKKNANEKIYCEITIASWRLDYKNYFTFFIHDITARKKNEEYILYRSKFEQMLAKISAQFIESGADKIENSIEHALRTMADFLGSNRACIFFLNAGAQKINCHYEWSDEKAERLISASQNLGINQFAELLNKLTQNSAIAISRDNAEKSFLKYLKLRKVQSVLGLALYQQDKFVGFIDFEFKKKNYALKEEDVPLLSLFSRILGGEIQQLDYETQRREFEKQMRKMHEVIKQSVNSIIITDPEGKIEYVNPKFEETTEYKAEEVIGKTPAILKSGYTTDEEYKQLWKTITSGKEWRGVFKNRTKSGKYIWEKAIISPMKDENGKIINYLAIKEDITEQIQMKNQLDLARKMEAIGQLAAGIAHEINTPMQFISDNIEFLKNAFNDFIKYYWDVAEKIGSLLNDELNSKINEAITECKENYDIDYLMEEIPQALEQTHEGIARVTKIIKTMKDFSHPSSGEKEPADINKAIKDTVLLTRNTWKYVAELETELCDNPPLITCSIDQINQALLNIIVNAAQAIEEKIGKDSEKKGLIKIKTECSDNSLRIKISDTGTGIPQENIDKIFEPFFTTKEVGKGTGQGLALVHDIIVNKHGGTIEVESKENVGTTFTISLPLDKEEK